MFSSRLFQKNLITRLTKFRLLDPHALVSLQEQPGKHGNWPHCTYPLIIFVNLTSNNQILYFLPSETGRRRPKLHAWRVEREQRSLNHQQRDLHRPYVGRRPWLNFFELRGS